MSAQRRILAVLIIGLQLQDQVPDALRHKSGLPRDLGKDSLELWIPTRSRGLQLSLGAFDLAAKAAKLARVPGQIRQPSRHVGRVIPLDVVAR